MYIKNIKAVIFDMDGVLADTEPHHARLEQKLFKHLNLNISSEEHSSYLGQTSQKMWQEMVENKALSHSIDRLMAIHEEEAKRYFSDLPDIPPMSGVMEVLEYLSSKTVPMAVASSSSPVLVHIILRKIGITNFFRHIVSSVDAGKSKPEPDVFLLAASLLKAIPEECMVIEDSESGIQAAKAAGMLCIAFGGVNQSGADEHINDFRELKGLLSKYLV